MTTLRFDSTLPTLVAISTASYSAVSYRAQYQVPGGPWQDFGRASDESPTHDAAHLLWMPLVPSDTWVRVAYTLAGNPGDKYVIATEFSQNDTPLGPAIPNKGNLDDSGVAAFDVTVVLA